MTPPAILASAIFILAYLLIAWEKIHKTAVALGGAALVLLLGLVGQQEAFHGGEVDGIQVEGVDWNTILLLVGMMIIVSITRETGVFQWLAIKSAKAGRGRPIPIILLLSGVTAVLSALLDNVTTVLLIAPVTIIICKSLEVDPVPFLICEILASNIGGTATLVGDPPNIMIASQARLSFLDFIINLTPVAIIVFAFYAGTIWLVLRRRIQVTEENRAKVMEFDEARAITDKPLLWRCLVVLGLTLFGFVIHGWLGLEPATIALSGAALLLLVTGRHPLKHLEEVEWPTIFFFLGLFIMVSALVKQGVINLLSGGLLQLTHEDPVGTSLLVLWFSAIASAIVDNIPYVATMNPLIMDMARQMNQDLGWGFVGHTAIAQAPLIMPLWWSLALGACLGGNGSLIGASANVVVAGIAEKSGTPISFVRFLKWGVPLTIQSILISTVYVWLVYLRDLPLGP